MGTVIDSLFSLLMSWVRALVSAIWALFSSDSTTLLGFLGKNWIAIAALIIIAGLVIDWLVWLIRWQPYHIWAMRVRRLLRIGAPGDEDTDEAYFDDDLQEDMAAEELPPLEAAPEGEEALWLPLASPVIDEEEAQQVIRDAGQVPDETLGQYPGMRYDSAAVETDMSGTRRYGAVHAEGPGAAEVSRRRAEIDAWQAQMQEEARQRAQAERAAREAEQARIAQEAYEAEQARLAQEAYEAEQARLAQEAYEAEQARLAQEEYERRMAEYERQKAQYALELAEYERKKAEYEAALAQQTQQAKQTEQTEQTAMETPGARTRRMPAVRETGAAEAIETARQAQAVQEIEAAQDMEPSRRKRRRRNMTYSDYVEGEAVEQLPAPPAWTQMTDAQPASEAPKEKKKSLLRLGVNKMAQMMEPDQEDIVGIAALPPRVDRHKAYKPAKRPPKEP